MGASKRFDSPFDVSDPINKWSKPKSAGGQLTVIMFRVGHDAQNMHQDVLTVQTLLKTRGYDPGKIDGICGAKTVKAIRDFQSTFLTNPDGVIEPNRKTWFELSSTSAVSTNPRFV